MVSHPILTYVVSSESVKIMMCINLLYIQPSFIQTIGVAYWFFGLM